MAKTKAQLVEDAEAKGLTLTGDETASELKDLLASAGVDEGNVEADPAPSVDVHVDTHIQIEGGDFELAPVGWSKDRRITLNGRNYEHVSDDPTTGVWIYRSM